MVGDFFRNNILIKPENYKFIEDGTPIVADMKTDFPHIQFGVYSDGNVIIQRYIPKLLMTVVESISFADFCDKGNYNLFEYTPSKYSYSKSDCFKLANKYIGAYFMGYASVFGDDFVFRCMVGDDCFTFFEESKMGRHYKYRYKEQHKYLKLGIYLYHHFIAIEEDWAIHFSDGKDDKGPTIIRLEDFNDVVARSDYAIQEVKHNDDSLSALLASRNRAIFEWATGRNFGGYKMTFNNCEHFANFCRTGNKKGFQVARIIGDIAMSVITAYATKKPVPLLYLKKRYLDK